LISQVRVDDRYKESYWLPKRHKTRSIQKIELDQQNIDILVCDFKVTPGYRGLRDTN